MNDGKLEIINCVLVISECVLLVGALYMSIGYMPSFREHAARYCGNVPSPFLLFCTSLSNYMKNPLNMLLTAPVIGGCVAWFFLMQRHMPVHGRIGANAAVTVVLAAFIAAEVVAVAKWIALIRAAGCIW